MTPRSCIPVPKIEEDCYDWYERHRSRCELTRANRYDLVFIGDSITHFWADESSVTYGASVWHEYYDRRSVFNLGFGFDRTQNVLWRLENGELEGQSPRMIVLNIGTNQFSETPKYPRDTAEDAAAGILCVVDRLRRMFPDAELVVMAILPRGLEMEPYQNRITHTNELVSKGLKGKKGILFLDLSPQYRNADSSLKTELYNGCFCHLNPAGYRVWAEALEPEINRILGEGNH